MDINIIDSTNRGSEWRRWDLHVYSGIYESVRIIDKAAIGIYAALKGYDAIIEPHGNNRQNSFLIILNRSKVIVKK